jgi:hypothetical protein
MSKIFGGSKSKSYNKNNSVITNALSPLLGSVTAADNQLGAFLSGDTNGFDKFADAAGFNFEAARGVDQLGSAFSGRNVFRSGARDKAIAEFGQGLSGRYAQQYIQSLLGRGSQALGAGQLIAGVGQESENKSKPGIGALVGGGFSGAASLGWKPFTRRRPTNE